MKELKVKALLCVLVVTAICGVTGLALAWSAKAKRAKHSGNEVESGGVVGWSPKKLTPDDYINRIHVQISDSQRFGIVCPRLRDPQNPDKPKKLTRDERGLTNNTCFRIEGYEYLFGHEIPGVRYVRENGKVMKEIPIADRNGAKGRAWQSVMEVEFTQVRITQTVEIVVGEQTRLYDTALVTYQITNRDKNPHTVGLRTMLDTYIGANDGVPFFIPPIEGYPARFVDKLEIFPQKAIPEYVMALENGDLNDPQATAAVLGLKIKNAEPIEKMVICRWPDNSEARWDWKYTAMDEPAGREKDSCVALYWAQVNMKPGEQRTLAFTYGLGRMGDDDVGGKIARNGKMRLFVAPRIMEKKPFTVTAYVKSTDANQTVTIKLPQGLTLVAGEKAERSIGKIGPQGFATVTWRVVAPKAGEYKVQTDAPNIGIATEIANVLEDSIFGG